MVIDKDKGSIKYLSESLSKIKFGTGRSAYCSVSTVVGSKLVTVKD